MRRDAELPGSGSASRPAAQDAVPPSRQPRIAPGQVWFVDFDPVRGRDQGRDRPALVVSSDFHLELTHRQLITVLPLTSVERPGWLHRVGVGASDGYVITEQIRTVAATRFRRFAPELALSDSELADVRRIFALMLTL